MEKIQRRLPELIDLYLEAALAGDKDALKWCLERGMGKAAVATQAVADTEIKVVLGAIPRPGRANGPEDAGRVVLGPDEMAVGSEDGDCGEPGEEALPLEDDGAALEEGAEEEEEAVGDGGDA